MVECDPYRILGTGYKETPRELVGHDGLEDIKAHQSLDLIPLSYHMEHMYVYNSNAIHSFDLYYILYHLTIYIMKMDFQNPYKCLEQKPKVFFFIFEFNMKKLFLVFNFIYYRCHMLWVKLGSSSK